MFPDILKKSYQFTTMVSLENSITLGQLVLQITFVSLVTCLYIM
jgi:hypothetical protein